METHVLEWIERPFPVESADSSLIESGAVS
jgi:hypothetical protein